MGDVDKDMAEEGLHTHPPVSVKLSRSTLFGFYPGMSM
jgi:hypothetical protein